jgi:nitrite reductase/ring-hydroxylating ferredoxin subunit
MLCAVADLPVGGITAADVESSTGGFSLIVVHDADGVRAFHNECPHAGRRLDFAPGRFIVENGYLVCAAHGASFSMRDGACLGGPCRGAGLKPVPVRVENGEVVLG